MAKGDTITAEQVRKILDYDPETGSFRWKIRNVEDFSEAGRGGAKGNAARWNARHAGKIAGRTTDKGYVAIGMFETWFFAHRVAVLLMTGAWPDEDTDHENLNKSDNSWENIRNASRTQNRANTPLRVDNTSGFKGVVRNGKKWRAQTMIGGARRYLGLFETAEQASLAYQKAAAELFGKFSRV